MKKIIILTFIHSICIIQGMDTQVSIITKNYIKNFISLNPCFFAADKSDITAEYIYWDNQECKSLLVQKNLLIEKKLLSIEKELIVMSENLLEKRTLEAYKKKLEEKKELEPKLFIIHRPYENKNILNSYFFKNQLRFPYAFKKKNVGIQQDIEEIKAFINKNQALILAKSPKINVK